MTLHPIANDQLAIPDRLRDEYIETDAIIVTFGNLTGCETYSPSRSMD